MVLKSQPGRARAWRGVAALGLGLCSPAAGTSPTDDDPAAETAPNIVQPGAPGQGSKTLSADELSEIEAPTFVEADVSFMQDMILHHAQALRMTALVPKRSAGTELPLLAERMDISQKGEIEQMQQLARGSGAVRARAHRAHQHAHGVGREADAGHAPRGSAAPAGAGPGEGLRQALPHFMIHHHQGALVMVRRLYAANGGAEPETDAFARHVEADQLIEIDRMQELLAELRQP